MGSQILDVVGNWYYTSWGLRHELPKEVHEVEVNSQRSLVLSFPAESGL